MSEQEKPFGLKWVIAFGDEKINVGHGEFLSASNPEEATRLVIRHNQSVSLSSEWIKMLSRKIEQLQGEVTRCEALLRDRDVITNDQSRQIAALRQEIEKIKNEAAQLSKGAN